MKTSYEKVKTWTKNTKKRLVAAFGGKYGICGYDKCNESLEFHHIDPDTKKFSFGARCIAWNKISIEAKKCVMLCANCHREIHYGYTKIPDDITRFDDNFTNYKRKKIYDICPVCGGERMVGNKTCSNSCSTTMINNIGWENYDLEKMYNEKKNYSAVGRIIGVCGTSVKKRMIKEGII